MKGQTRVLRFRGIDKLYIHDDGLGPYARMRFASPKSANIKGHPYEEGFDKFKAESSIWNAIIPLYPKIRLSADVEQAGDGISPALAIICV